MESLVESAVRGAHPQRRVKHDKRLPHRVYDILGICFDFCEEPLRPPPFRHVFNGENQKLGVVAGTQPAGVQQHGFRPDSGKVMGDFKVIKNRLLRNNIFKQRPQGRNIPLAVAEFVDQLVFGFAGGNVKSLVKRAVGGADAKIGVKN